MRTILLIIFLFGQLYCFGQDSPSKKQKLRHRTSFYNVEYLLLINYPQRLSTGVNIYPRYFIKKRKIDFLIEATSTNYKSTWTIPHIKNEVQRMGKIARSQKAIKPKSLTKPIVRNYVSEAQTYKIKGKSYKIYKHINYNCYDPFCGIKHNHITTITGETYFSPQFGIVVSVDDQNLEFKLITGINGKKIPNDLIIQILKNRNTDDKIIQAYIKKTS